MEGQGRCVGCSLVAIVTRAVTPDVSLAAAGVNIRGAEGLSLDGELSGPQSIEPIYMLMATLHLGRFLFDSLSKSSQASPDVPGYLNPRLHQVFDESLILH